MEKNEYNLKVSVIRKTKANKEILKEILQDEEKEKTLTFGGTVL